VRVETSAEVAVWGERWLSDFVNDPAIRAEERETREWLASHWRQWSLEAWINSAYQMQRVWGGRPHDEFNANHAANNHWFLYRRERNGLLIWRMYAEYREAGLPVPEPILQHFDEWWRRLERASGMKEIAEAIEMTGPKGGPQGAAHLRKVEAQREIVTSVVRLIELGCTPSDAMRRAAKEHRRTVAAVKSAYLRWKAPLRKRRQAKESPEARALRMLAKG
jgi:hypothetical protein